MFDARTAWLALSRMSHLNAADATVAAETLGGPAQLFEEPERAAQLVYEAACKRVGRLPFEVGTTPDTPPPAAFSDACRDAERKAVSKIQARLESCGVRLLWFSHSEYPALLRHVPDAPLVLFARGNVIPEDELSVAVVGSRNATAYGLRVVEPLVQGLVEHGVTIVSGMARGLDAASHRTALRAGGRTLAFLGTRIDRAYPASSTDLYRAIPDSGCVLSEFPPGQETYPGQFLQRNRLIAGAARALLVIEAGSKSGTANTVAHAIGYDRPVYAVPGDITTERSRGTNDLIVRDMARPVREAADLLRDLGVEVVDSASPAKSAPQLEGAQARIWEALADDAKIVDQVARTAGLSVLEVRPALTAMEVAGHVLRTPSGAYRRA